MFTAREVSSIIQRSVFFTSMRRVAAASRRLVEHYGASTEVFRGRRTEL